jgi:hypothetical protein
MDRFEQVWRRREDVIYAKRFGEHASQIYKLTPRRCSHEQSAGRQQRNAVFLKSERAGVAGNSGVLEPVYARKFELSSALRLGARRGRGSRNLASL